MLVKVVTAIRVTCGSHMSTCAGADRYGFLRRIFLDVNSLSCLAAQLNALCIVATKMGVEYSYYHRPHFCSLALSFPSFHFYGRHGEWSAREDLKDRLRGEGSDLNDLLGERFWFISVRNLKRRL